MATLCLSLLICETGRLHDLQDPMSLYVNANTLILEVKKMTFRKVLLLKVTHLTIGRAITKMQLSWFLPVPPPTPYSFFLALPGWEALLPCAKNKKTESDWASSHIGASEWARPQRNLLFVNNNSTDDVTFHQMKNQTSFRVSVEENLKQNGKKPEFTHRKQFFFLKILKRLHCADNSNAQ